HRYAVLHPISLLCLSICLDLPPPLTPTLFPYTTLFRSPRSPPGCPAALRWTRRAHRRPPHSPADARSSAARRATRAFWWRYSRRSEEHTSELQSLAYLVCRLLLEKKKLTVANLAVWISS